MQKKSISVAMCTYNGADFIEEQIHSITKQTHLPKEVVICDDCSQDNTVEIIKNIILNYSAINWKLISNDRQLGVRGNFKKALGLCTGDYIALADQDDIWESHKLETLYKCIEKGYALIHSDAILIDAKGNKLHPSLSGYLSKKKNIPLIEYLKGQNNITGCTCMIDAKLTKTGVVFPEHFFYHDCWLAILAYNNGGIYYCKEKLVQYRQHTKNVVGVKSETASKIPFREIRKKGKDYWKLIKMRSLIQLNRSEYLIIIRYWFTCRTGLALLKRKSN